MITIRGSEISDPNGNLDEIFADNCSVHLERMGDTQWCLILDEAATGRHVIIHLGYVKGRGKMRGGRYGFISEDDAGEAMK